MRPCLRLLVILMFSSYSINEGTSFRGLNFNSIQRKWIYCKHVEQLHGEWCWRTQLGSASRSNVKLHYRTGANMTQSAPLPFLGPKHYIVSTAFFNILVAPHPQDKASSLPSLLGSVPSEPLSGRGTSDGQSWSHVCAPVARDNGKGRHFTTWETPRISERC